MHDEKVKKSSTGGLDYVRGCQLLNANKKENNREAYTWRKTEGVREGAGESKREQERARERETERARERERERERGRERERERDRIESPA